MAHSYTIICSTDLNSNADYNPNPQGNLPDVVPDRVVENVKSRFNVVCPNQESPLNKSIDENDGLEYIQGQYRFCDENTDVETICGVIENEVVNDAMWYIVKHHRCDHDKGDDIGCSTDEVICNHGDVPEQFL